MGKRPFVDRTHVWEDPELLRRATEIRAWEEPVQAEPARGGEDDDVSSDDEPLVQDLTAEAAGHEFIQTLSALYFARKLSAKVFAFCVTGLTKLAWRRPVHLP